VFGLLLGSILSIEVPVRVEAELPDRALETALSEADRLFAAGGIRFLWQPGALPSSGSASIVIRPRPDTAVVSGCSRNLHDHRLGLTLLEARRVTLWTEQVARAIAGSWGRKNPPRVDEAVLGTALGRVLAHELGHLFLRLNGHREDGLMKPSFSQRSLIGKSDRSFRLSERDMGRVREALTRLKVARTDQ